MDTVLAIYKNLFSTSSRNYDWTYDLIDIAEYYILFDQLMAFWSDMFPGRIHQIKYESLITDQEPLAWINSPTDMYVSRRFGQDHRLARAVRELLERPLWHFMADQGRRVRCMFCGRTLDIPSSRMLGYGPVCAEHLGLYWFTS